MASLTLEFPAVDTGLFNFGQTTEADATVAHVSFRAFIERVNPGLRFYTHVGRLIAVLQRVADDELDRLMVFLPPRHTKSELVSRLFTAYYLYRHPERWVGLNSYGADLAYSLSRNSRDNYQRFGGAVRGDAAAVKQWETGGGGGLWAAGVGGPITGKGFHLGIIDDPVKNAEEASSPTIQERHRDWYSSTFYTRGEPGNAIIVIQTRWNEADLSGWLLSQENDDEPERWHIVNLPAIAEDDPQTFPPTCTVERDFRQAGAALCPERYDIGKLAKLQRRVGDYFWSALYQQRPTPLEGGLFKRQWFPAVRALPVGCRFVRYWDKAATPGGGDYTVGALWARSPDDRFICVDVVRGQWSPGEREAVIRQTAELDRTTYGNVAIRGEQEPGSSGVESAQNTVRGLIGFNAKFERVTGDKLTRAMPLAAQAEAGNVSILAGAWNAAFIDELCMFPNGRHDDQVDASSGAFATLANATNNVAVGQSAIRNRGGGPNVRRSVRRVT